MSFRKKAKKFNRSIASCKAVVTNIKKIVEEQQRQAHVFASAQSSRHTFLNSGNSVGVQGSVSDVSRLLSANRAIHRCKDQPQTRRRLMPVLGRRFTGTKCAATGPFCCWGRYSSSCMRPCF